MGDAPHKANKFYQLQQKYIQQLPNKLTQIQQHWQAWKTQYQADDVEAVKRLVHSLAGSAGTFHFSQLSEQARLLEQYLFALTTDKLSDTQEQEIESAFIELQKQVEKGPEVIVPDTNISPASEPEPSRPEYLIYVVEDDKHLAEEIRQQLCFFGYQVETFHDATTALEKVQQQLPTAMIIDVQLPEGELAGTALAQHFHHFSAQKIPLIFISMRDDWDARLAAVRGGGQAYLVKPIDFSELLDRLDMLTRTHERAPFRVLVVDDMALLAEQYALALTHAGMSTQVVTDANRLFEPLYDFKPELILMDLNMPHCSGGEAAKVIRQKEEFTSIPIVYLSTESNHDCQLNAMRLGGDDFLEKPISNEDLVAAVSIRAERFRNIRSLMNRDSLTGLLNHATIKTYLETEISRLQRQQTGHLSFAIVDLDHFKSVNDTYGHPTGDRVIKSISRLLSQRLRKSDLIGRYGGEEFAVIFPDTDVEAAMNVVNELRERFASIIHVHQNQRFSCTFSAGIAAMPPYQSNMDELIRHADEALYQAKHAGRNRVERYSAESVSAHD